MIPTNYCNMKCKYCFFDKKSISENRMSISTLKQVMKIILPYYDRVSFVWHGGEPLSMGIDFYKSVIDIQKEYQNKCNVKIKNTIQSNLTLLNKEYAEFLVLNHFGVGGSYDGINNELTRGKTNKILQGRQIYEDAGGHCGLIFVASKLTVDTFIDSYNWFKSQHINFKVNPYLGADMDLMLDYPYYTQKLIELFQYWALDTDTPISISIYDWIIDFILFQKKHVCSYTSCLGKWASINYSGTIKPCNRYFPDEYSFGNIFDYDRFDQAFDSPGFKELIIQSIKRREKCKECRIFDYCSGGCNYVAMTENGGIENNLGNHCECLLELYDYINDFINKNEGNPKLNTFIKKKFELSYIKRRDKNE